MLQRTSTVNRPSNPTYRTWKLENAEVTKWTAELAQTKFLPQDSQWTLVFCMGLVNPYASGLYSFLVVNSERRLVYRKSVIVCLRVASFHSLSGTLLSRFNPQLLPVRNNSVSESRIQMYNVQSPSCACYPLLAKALISESTPLDLMNIHYSFR